VIGRAVETVVVEDAEARRLRMLWDAGRLTVGAKVGVGGRLYVVHGFDPVGTNQRRMDAEDRLDGAVRRFVIAG
jgi:hypothetical protein